MIGIAKSLENRKNLKDIHNTFYDSYLIYSAGGLYYHKKWKLYAGANYNSGDEIGVLLDMWKGELKFVINGIDKGVAHQGEELTQGEFFFAVDFYEKD